MKKEKSKVLCSGEVNLRTGKVKFNKLAKVENNTEEKISKLEQIRCDELLSENTDDILRKFATGRFIKTPLTEKFEKQIRQEIIKGIERLPKYVENGQPIEENGRFIRKDDVINLISDSK